MLSPGARPDVLMGGHRSPPAREEAGVCPAYICLVSGTQELSPPQPPRQELAFLQEVNKSVWFHFSYSTGPQNISHHFMFSDY